MNWGFFAMKLMLQCAPCLLLVLLLAPGAARAAPPQTITVGTVELRYCNSVYLGYCGSIDRKLDPRGAVSGTLAIGFEYSRDAISRCRPSAQFCRRKVVPVIPPPERATPISIYLKPCAIVTTF